MIKNNNFSLNLKDLEGNLVPDSAVSCTFRDMKKSTGDYITDCANNVVAYDEYGNRFHLKKYSKNQVKFIAGLWRIQRQDDRVITSVRDKLFILGDKLDVHEKNLFEYYKAAEVHHNCYGIMPTDFDYIVAKYDTKTGPVWGYGTTVEEARAFLGIALFDKYNDAIHVAARGKGILQK